MMFGLMRMLSLFPFLAGAVFALAASYSHACTGGGLVATDGSVVSGRTLEFGVPLDSSLIVYPAGSTFQGDTPKGPGTGLKFTAKYGFGGLDAFGHTDAIAEGVNEAGLSAGIFYFAGVAKFMEDDPSKYDQGISPIQVVTYFLSQFETVEEVKAGLKDVSILPVVLKALKGVPPVHYRVTDASGKCIAIEPIKGEINVFDNPLRSFTNNPEFPWMLTNLQNYVTLSPDYPETMDLNGYKIPGTGNGQGLFGLPGDFSPPSRFVRVTLFTQFAPEQPSAAAATATMFHILNNFDIPPGSAIEPEEGIGFEFTTWTAVTDLENRIFYWKTFGHQNIAMVDLKQALKIAGDQMLSLPLPDQNKTSIGTALDVTGELQAAK